MCMCNTIVSMNAYTIGMCLVHLRKTLVSMEFCRLDTHLSCFEGTPHSLGIMGQVH